MNFKALILMTTVTLCVYGSEPHLTLEGYAEGFFLSNSRGGSELIADMMVEPTLYLNDQVKVSVGIGFAHPAEDGGVFEAELEVLSLDTMVTEDTDFSFGKVHMPVGLYNLYHEPIYFLTIQPSRVEHLVIPTEWHETAALVSHKWGEYSLVMGAMSGMDARTLNRGSWILEGKESHLTDGGKVGWVGRLEYGKIEKTLVGSSIVRTPLRGSAGQATLFEAHASARMENGWWEAMGIVSKGWISNIQSVQVAAGDAIAKNAQGASVTVGYDIGHHFALTHRQAIIFAHSEYAQPAQSLTPEGLGGSAWATGINWFFSPHIVAKAEYRNSNHEGQRFGIGMGVVY